MYLFLLEWRPEPELRSGELPAGGAGRRRPGRVPLVQGEGVEWRARVRSGGSPSAGAAVGLEFPSKGIRREFCQK